GGEFEKIVIGKVFPNPLARYCVPAPLNAALCVKK
ncbi:TPA: GNAT family N-acetyltransferase, partial [Vibrio vulnificus]|nr:GNAT family N-acetyltransferase [Vibrio vulnificus]